VRMIDADALIKWFRPYGHLDEKATFDVLAEDINGQPTIDAVEVVRCSECIMFGTYERTRNGYCKHYNGLMNPKSTDFCSHGKRRCEQ
jgi:hypothetical protein